MNDKRKTKAQLISELQALRQDVDALQDRLSTHAQREVELQKQADHLRLAQELSLDAFTILRSVRNGHGQIVDFEWEYANPTAAMFLRRPLEALVGHRLLQVLPGNQTSSELFTEYVRVAETGAPLDQELYYKADGIDGWFWNKTIKIGDGVANFFSDITPRKRLEEMERQQTEEALHESEERYRMLFENANDAIAVVNLDRSITTINRAMEKLLGWSHGELIGQDYYSVLTPTGIALVEERERRLQAGEKIPSIFEHEFLRKDGSTVPVEGRIRFIRDQAGTPTGFQGIHRDISERKRTEEALQAERDFALQVMNTMGQGLAVTNAEYCIEYVNPALLRMFGFQPEEVIGKPLMHFCPPREQTLGLQMREQMRRGEIVTYEIHGRHANGQEVPLLITGVARQHEGKTAGSILVISDLTEQKRTEAERQQLQAQLLQVQKLEAVGVLAGGVAHDFNNILTTILGNTELALDDVLAGSRVHENLTAVLTAGQRAQALVRQLLTFSRHDQHGQHPVWLQPLVEETLRFLRVSLPKTVTLQTDLTCPTTTVLANPIQIQQLLMNLCINAAQAMQDQGGVLHVGLQRIDAADCPRCAHGAAPSDSCLMLTVRDTGCGMTPEVQERIFEPFFTTKPVGEGTGLGLAVVHGIVRNHGGAITVDSQPGQGTTFWVYLPIVDAVVKSNVLTTAMEGNT